MTEQEEKELRDKIRSEEKEKVEAELTQRQETETELREKIREEETKLAEARFERRQGFISFAEEICTGEVALSALPEDVVALLEDLTDDQAEQAKTLLKAKVADFREAGSDGDGKEAPKFTLSDVARQDVINGELTLQRLFDASVIPGQPEDYDLSEFSLEQKGF